MTPQGGGAMQHRHAVVSFHHALHSPDFRGADGVTSPAWVTAELRCTADFKSTSQPQLVETLRIGIDVEVSQAAGVAASGLLQRLTARLSFRPAAACPPQQPVCLRDVEQQVIDLWLQCTAAVAGAAIGADQWAAPHGRRQEHAGLPGVTGWWGGATLPGGPRPLTASRTR